MVPTPIKFRSLSRFPACTSSLVGNSLWSLDQRGENLVYGWSWRIFRHYPKLDSCNAASFLWDNPEGQWWREILTEDRISGTKSLFALLISTNGQTWNYILIHRASLVTHLVKNPPTIQEAWVWYLGLEDTLEEGKAIHSSILAWRTHGLYSGKESDNTEGLSLSLSLARTVTGPQLVAHHEMSFLLRESCA